MAYNKWPIHTLVPDVHDRGAHGMCVNHEPLEDRKGTHFPSVIPSTKNRFSSIISLLNVISISVVIKISGRVHMLHLFFKTLTMLCYLSEHSSCVNLPTASSCRNDSGFHSAILSLILFFFFFSFCTYGCSGTVSQWIMFVNMSNSSTKL